MDAQTRSEGTELRLASSESIPPAAVWESLTEAQQERVRQSVAQVCREWLREGVGDETA